MRTLTLALLLLAAPALAAPAPFRRAEKPAPAAHVTPGRWAMSWAESPWDVTLYGGGQYRAECCGSRWAGTWDYDPPTRVLSVTETSEEGLTITWAARLDAALSGETEPSAIRVALARR